MPDYKCLDCGETDQKAFMYRGPKRKQCKQCHHDMLMREHRGMTYGEMLEEFGDYCGICFLPETVTDWRTGGTHRLSVDHDHNCCKAGCPSCVRGLLCRKCNYRLGLFESDWMNSAKEYLGGGYNS